MDLAYNDAGLCKVHNVVETDLQSPRLVSQAVLITPLELSASISTPNYLDLSLQNVASPGLSCKLYIVDLPVTPSYI